MQFRKIVVGLDFTEPSLAAARGVATFAPAAEIVLAHVIEEHHAPSIARSEPLTPLASLYPGITGALRGFANLIGSDRTRFEVLAGDAPTALAELADREEADLVCVGRGRRRRGSARFGATTAQRLLVRSRVPTIVVPVHLGVPSRILAAVDDRPGGDYVFETGCGLGASGEAWVDAIHIIESELHAPAGHGSRTAEPHGRHHQWSEWPASIDETDNGWMHERARKWVDARLDDVTVTTGRAASVIATGDAGEEIVRHARQSNTDLIVIGRGGDASHARAPSGALPLGSVTRLVLWAAPCSVLVLPLGSRNPDVQRSRSPRASEGVLQ
jgi:nucleotide-binding universal stress UspA family protein